MLQLAGKRQHLFPPSPPEPAALPRVGTHSKIEVFLERKHYRLAINMHGNKSGPTSPPGANVPQGALVLVIGGCDSLGFSPGAAGAQGALVLCQKKI